MTLGEALFLPPSHPPSPVIKDSEEYLDVKVCLRTAILKGVSENNFLSWIICSYSEHATQGNTR